MRAMRQPSASMFCVVSRRWICTGYEHVSGFSAATRLASLSGRRMRGFGLAATLHGALVFSRRHSSTSATDKMELERIKEKFRAMTVDGDEGKMHFHVLSDDDEANQVSELLPEDPRARILGIRLDNIRKKNAMTPKMMVELADIVDRLEAVGSNQKRDGACGVVLYGDQGTFCSGFSLDYAKKYFRSSEAGVEMNVLMRDTLTRMRDCGLVVVGGIEGNAVGGGSELALSTDLLVMKSNAKISFVQGRMGVVMGWNGQTHLVDRVGRSVALKLLLGCMTVDAKTGQTIGLIDCVAEGDLLSECVRLIGGLESRTIRGLKKSVAGRNEFSNLWGTGRNLEILMK